jgi:Xaa-Pro aminopeptidase
MKFYMKTYIEKLSALRAWLEDNQLQGFLLPVSDEYLGEYQADYAKRVEWLSGFDGSAGLLLVTLQNAVLFTDGRYILQAAAQLDGELFEVIDYGKQSIIDYVKNAQLSHIGFDAKLHSVRQIEAWKHQLNLFATLNPVDELWENQPARPCAPVFVHDEKLAGMSSIDKIALVVAQMQADNLLINEADCICWLLNIRGGDVPYNPLPLCRAILNKQGAVKLFIDPQKMQGLEMPNVEVLPESDIDAYLYGDFQFCTNATPYYFAQKLAENNANVIRTPNPIAMLKAVKNVTEIEGIKKAHLVDAIAVKSLIKWFDEVKSPITELDVVAKLEELRASHPDYRGASFPTIAGAGSNGAIVHYRPTNATNRLINDGDVLLLDSGGQYEYGTTDITRTLVRGLNHSPHASAAGKALASAAPPQGGSYSSLQSFRKHFTYVLKGHIALANAVFPLGTTGHQLDVLARQFLWQHGLDYAHGTGHGVGHYLCVHEGPQSISTRANGVALQAGMVLSNEPAYYVTGEYGIRIESLVLVVEKMQVDGVQYLGFETLTQVPIDAKLVDFTMMNDAEKTWLEHYNYSCKHKSQ